MSVFEVVKVIKNNNGRGLKYEEKVMDLLLPPMPVPLPFVEIEWEVEINDLSYQLEGWTRSRVFKKEDSLKIKKQVASYYEELRNILNNGDTDEWRKRISQERNDIWICSYEKKANIKENWDAILKEVKEECQGNMLPLEDYELCFYANGRVL